MIRVWLESPTVDLQPLSGLGAEALLLVPALGLVAAEWRAQLPLLRGVMGEWRVRACCGGSRSRRRTTCCCRGRTEQAGPSSIIWRGCRTASW